MSVKRLPELRELMLTATDLHQVADLFFTLSETLEFASASKRAKAPRLLRDSLRRVIAEQVGAGTPVKITAERIRRPGFWHGTLDVGLGSVFCYFSGDGVGMVMRTDASRRTHYTRFRTVMAPAQDAEA